uniref:Uncharacterized protein n=1 Tax=Glossina palpalis gambiensis TaxID=67801 RepID=A0A1B0B3X5_9MUSC
MSKLLNYFEVLFVHLLLLSVKWVTTQALQHKSFPWQNNDKFFKLNFRTANDVLLQAALDRLNFNIKANELELNRRVQAINSLYNEVTEWARNEYQTVIDYQNKMCQDEQQQSIYQNELDANDDRNDVEEKEKMVIEHETEQMQPHGSDLNENQLYDDRKEEEENEKLHQSKLDLNRDQDYDDQIEQTSPDYEDEFPLQDKLGLNQGLDDDNGREKVDFDRDEGDDEEEDETHQLKSDTNQVQGDSGIEEVRKVEEEYVNENENENQKLDYDNLEKLSAELLKLSENFKRLEHEIESHMLMIGEHINEYQASLGRLNTLEEEVENEDEEEDEDENESRESYVKYNFAFRNNLRNLLEAIESDISNWDIDKSQN